MVDTVDKATRRRIMQSIKGRNTKPERILYRAMRKINLRPRRWDKSLPGKPDFVLRAPDGVVKQLAVMVDGCFWHACPRHWSPPKSNKKFWAKKIHDNVARDLRVNAQLHELGWDVLRIWECDVREDPGGCAMMVGRFLYLD